MPNVKTRLTDKRRLSVAPMMDRTDRHCRLFHRQFSTRALLYTEMIPAAAVVYGDVDRFCAHDSAEHPLALQLGGSDPEILAEAVRRALPFGFAEIDLNVGCPSDRVRSGAFGACLMQSPDLVAECTTAMIEAAGGGPEITVKCRIGVDDQDPEIVLPDFIDRVAASGIRRFAVHARKALLKGLSPKQNRTIPPLDYDLVRRVKAARPKLRISLNGGIETLDQAASHLSDFDGVMIGRAAYSNPAGILGGADCLIAGESVVAGQPVAPEEAIRAMYPHIENELVAGTTLHRITRHMLGAFDGQPGARRWRRVLSDEAHRKGAGPDVIERALAQIRPQVGQSPRAAA